MFQGEVPLKKVNFSAKNEPDYIKNFKILQTTFEKKQITRVSIIFLKSFIASYLNIF